MTSDEVFWLLVALSLVAAVGAALIVRRRLWLVVPLAAGGIALAWWYVSGADPEREYDELGRLITAVIVLAGWLFGLAATPVWVFARRSGEQSKQRRSRTVHA
jgi:hypothetical protein